MRDRVLVRHPLQPYDARNFEPGGRSGAGRSASTPPPWPARVRRAGSAPRARPLLAGPLPAATAEDVSLADLKAFLTHPVRAFLRGRLDVSRRSSADEVDDAIPVELDALEMWGVGDRLLREVLAGAGPVAVMTAEQLRGTLPPGGLGHLRPRRA